MNQYEIEIQELKKQVCELQEQLNFSLVGVILLEVKKLVEQKLDFEFVNSLIKI
jgi:hypothetical protein